ncbi:unnamed protein product [Protopolystoma xenopodis]|uniref:Nucleoporin NSP1-like C-terminal domain-containing protein n=1 Tax=Protopolystoma xenopodis TaxID=117903 RepID=A0A3S5BCW8_9PLAT|nr:unnamed protein product [Protopolystoma xenopodis]
MFPLPSANSVAKPTDSFLNLSASAGNAPPTSGALSFGIAAQSPNQFGLGAQASPQQASNAMSFAFSTNAQSLLATAPAPINSPAAGFVATSNKPVVSPAPFTGFGLSASTTSSTSQSPIFKPAFAGAPATPQNLFPTPSSKDFSLTTAASPSTPSLNFSFAPKLSSAVAPPIASSPQFSFTLPVSTAPTSTAPLTSDLGQSRGLQPSTTTADEQHNSKLFSASTSAAVTSFSIPASSAAASLAATIATSTTSDSPKSTFSFGLGTSFFQPPSTSGSSTPSLLTTVASSVSTSGGLVQQPKLTYRQLEELVNRWTLELDEQERHFLNEVTRLNQWDQVLISNAEKIAALHDKVEASKAEQTRIENVCQHLFRL